MRLPTVAEWEYIGAASKDKANASRDPEFLQTILDWYSVPRDPGGLSPVRRGRPNLYGIYDLHSLIWEWVEDFNSSLQAGEGRSEGSLNKDLFCGGGGASGANKEDYAAYMRFAFRSSQGFVCSLEFGLSLCKGCFEMKKVFLNLIFLTVICPALAFAHEHAAQVSPGGAPSGDSLFS